MARNGKYPPIQDLISRDEWHIAKKFFNQPQNRGITLATIMAVDQELYEHTTALQKLGRRTVISERNVILDGRNTDGKLRIALIDVE